MPRPRAGSEVEITLREPFQNRRKWRGTLESGGSDVAWRLLLPSDKPVSRTALKRAAKAAAAGEVDAAAHAQQVLDFLLDEVREARLVPVVDFKGRRGLAQDDEIGPEAEKIDGGQD